MPFQETRSQRYRSPVAQLRSWIFLIGWQGEESLKFLHIGQLTSR
jgi:hypothetical protein